MGSPGPSRRSNRPPGRSGKPPRCLLEPVGWGLARAPLLPADAYPEGVADSARKALVPEEPLVQAALAVGTDHLLAALQRTRGSAAEAPRLRAKLLRYLIRMATRPTPYGLFAGVGLIEWGSTTDAALTAQPVRTRARPDMGWLLDFVMRLERDPDIRRDLRLVTNPLALTRAGWVFLSEWENASDAGEPAARTLSVRATAATQRVLTLARTPTSYADLAADLLSRPGATRTKVEALIDELWRHRLLLTDLRPPLTGVSPGRYVYERLRPIPAARAVHETLGELLDAHERWDALPLEERADAWAALTQQAERLHRPSRPEFARAARVDTALPMAGRRVHVQVAKEAAAAGDLLLRLSPHPLGLPHLHAYRLRFESRYGADREVPLLELLDPDFGLGPPNEEDRRAYPPPDVRRHRTLLDLALEALRERRMVVELDDDLLGRLQTRSLTAEAAPRSVDISVFLAAASPAAVDAGDFLLIVGPNLGANAAGRTLGRFADLLGSQARAALETVARRSQRSDGRLPVELVYLPRATRAANVAVRPALVDHEIVSGTMPGVPADRTIPPNELLVGVRDGRFYVRWPPAEAEIAVSEMHMLNPLYAPPALMFLEEVERDRRVAFAPFSWGPAAEFPFLPRVQRGRVVLVPARWRVSATSGLGAKSNAFEDALRVWCERWSVPRHVYLADGDHRLLLDLKNPGHADVLREDLRRKRGLAILEEALPNVSHAWLPGPAGSHIVELVVPLVARTAPGPRVAKSSARRPAPTPPHVRLRPPGSDWLYLKMYGPPTFQDDLIADELAPFAEFAISAALARCWFFIRYSDPDPHLRIRFRGKPDVLLNRLMAQVCSWASSLVADGLCTHFGFDTYEREVERYGGEAGVELAEDLFAIDSRAAAALLGLERDLPTIDRYALAVLSVDASLAALGLGSADRLAHYRVAALSRADGQEYRRRQALLRRLIGRRPTAEPGAAALERTLDDRRRALEPIAARLEALARDRALCQVKATLLSDYLHMHCNRLLGSDPASERLVLQLARRTAESLARAPARSGPRTSGGLDHSDRS
jgi:lantibiotic biosynthesis protein